MMNLQKAAQIAAITSAIIALISFLVHFSSTTKNTETAIQPQTPVKVQTPQQSPPASQSNIQPGQNAVAASASPQEQTLVDLSNFNSVNMFTELKPFRGTRNNETFKLLNMSGKSYEGLIVTWDGIYWRLDKKIEYIAFKVGCTDDMYQTQELNVYGDGTMIKRIPKLTHADGIQDIQIKTSGINILKLHGYMPIVNFTGKYSGSLVLENGGIKFTKLPLDGANIMGASYPSRSYRLSSKISKVSGIPFLPILTVTTDEPCYWNLEKKYSKLTLLVGCIDDYISIGEISIKGDSRHLLSIQQLTNADGVRQFEVPVSGVDRLSIESRMAEAKILEIAVK